MIVIRRSTDRKYYYIVTAKGNGETLVTSQMYKSKQAVKTGIRSLKLNVALFGRVTDET